MREMQKGVGQKNEGEEKERMIREKRVKYQISWKISYPK